MAAMMLSEGIAVAALLVVSGSAAARWLRRRRDSDLDVFLAFSPIALVGLLELMPDPEQYYANPAVLAVTYVQPVLFCRLLRRIGHRARVPAAISAAGGLWSILIVVRDPHVFDVGAAWGWDLLVASVAAYLVPNLWVGLLFARAARRSVGVTKVRLAWAALSAFLFIAAMFAYAIPRGSAAAVASDVIYVSLAVAFLLGFAPPRWVQRSWRATAYVQFDKALSRIPSGASPEAADRALLEATKGVLDADAIRFAPARSGQAGELSAVTGASGDHAYLVATFRRPRMFPDDDRMTVEALAGHCWQQLEPRERLQREEAARKAAEDQASFKASFLRHFGHEVANPLSPIRVKASILAMTATPEQKPHLEVIQRNLKRIEDIIADVSSVARAIDPRAPRELVEVDLGALLADAATTYTDAAAKGQCSIALDVAPDARVLADRPRLMQAFDNLLSNAIKYSPLGGAIRVTVRGADGGMLVEVQDQGLGFDAEQAKLLFRTYSRVHKAVAPGIPGSGLGLYLVQEVAHAHGGWAKAASAGPGLGSTFSVWLPLKPPAAPELAAFRA